MDKQFYIVGYDKFMKDGKDHFVFNVFTKVMLHNDEKNESLWLCQMSRILGKLSFMGTVMFGREVENIAYAGLHHCFTSLTRWGGQDFLAFETYDEAKRYVENCVAKNGAVMTEEFKMNMKD